MEIIQSAVEQEYLSTILATERDRHIERWLLSEAARKNEAKPATPKTSEQRSRPRRISTVLFSWLPAGLRSV